MRCSVGREERWREMIRKDEYWCCAEYGQRDFVRSL